MALPSLSFKASDMYRTKCFFIYGKIKDGQSNAPLANAHVYTITGEEEGFSARDGVFRFKTWGSVPLYIHVKHPGFLPQTIILDDAYSELDVSLRPE
jgi:hypothetical protein